MNFLSSRLFVAVSLSIFTLPVSAQVVDPNADILGKWTIVKHVSPNGATSSLTARDVRRLLGKSVNVSAELFEFNGHRCMLPDYRRSEDAAADYFYREWRVNSDEMPVGDRVTIVENRCEENQLYPTSPDHMVVAEDGFFFEAVRIGSQAVATSQPRGQNNKKGSNADIFGTWMIDGADWMGSGYDNATEKKKKAGIYMGMPVYISAKRFFYNENQCKDPTYLRSRQEKTTYFGGDWRAAPGRLLFLPKILTVIETDCGTIYPISKKLIIIEDKRGMFFTAVPLSTRPVH